MPHAPIDTVATFLVTPRDALDGEHPEVLRRSRLAHASTAQAAQPQGHGLRRQIAEIRAQLAVFRSPQSRGH